MDGLGIGMNRLKSIKKSVLDIIYFGLSARVLSFIKGILIAYQIGANYKTDTYIVAFSATMLLTKVIGDGLTLSMVPVLQQIDRRDGKRGRIDFTNNLISTFTLISCILMAIGYIIAPLVIKILGPGFKGSELDSAIYLFRLGLPIMTAHFIRAICGGYLQSDHKFKAGAKSGVVNNIIYIVYLLLFSRNYGLEGLMIVGIIAVIGQIIVMMKAMIKGGYRLEFQFNLKDRCFIRIISFLLPIMIGIGINELNGAIDNSIGSILEPGTIAELNYANDIISLILGIFIVAIVTAIFPILSETFDGDNGDEFNKIVKFGFKLLLIITIPVSIMLIIFSGPIVSLFYERGEFSLTAAYLTSQSLKYYAIGLTGMSLLLYITRIYYAIHSTGGAMKLGLISLVINFILSIILSSYMGGMGIALATSISVTLATLYGVVDLKRRI